MLCVLQSYLTETFQPMSPQYILPECHLSSCHLSVTSTQYLSTCYFSINHLLRATSAIISKHDFSICHLNICYLNCMLSVPCASYPEFLLLEICLVIQTCWGEVWLDCSEIIMGIYPASLSLFFLMLPISLHEITHILPLLIMTETKFEFPMISKFLLLLLNDFFKYLHQYVAQWPEPFTLKTIFLLSLHMCLWSQLLLVFFAQ